MIDRTVEAGLQAGLLMQDVMDQTPGEVFITAFHRKKFALEIAKRTAYFTAALGGNRDVKSYEQHFPDDGPKAPRRKGGKAIGAFLEGKGKKPPGRKRPGVKRNQPRGK